MRYDHMNLKKREKNGSFCLLRYGVHDYQDPIFF